MEAPDSLVRLLERRLQLIPRWEHKPLWLFDSNEDLAVLKRLAGPSTQKNLEYFRWELSLLAELDRLGTPVQRPLPLLEGDVIKEIDGNLWTTYGFVPGESVSWNEQPTLEAQGAFLARLHEASAKVHISPRPHINPIEQFFERTLESDKALSTTSREVAATLAAPRMQGEIVMHGDLSCDNMLAQNGRPSGVIDFGMAQHHHWLVDLGFAVWRTARPSREALDLDPNRLRRYVSGYRAAAQIDIETLQTLPEAILGKGLFLISRIRRGAEFDESLTRARVDWVIDNLDAIRSAL